jgi:DnaJ like chaperone protein
VIGKLIGGIIGAALPGGLFITLIGVFFGHQYDKWRVGELNSPGHRRALNERFLEATFTVAGQLAKSDGRVSEAEVAHTEAIIVAMGLSSDHRRVAIDCFKRGAAGQVDGVEVAAQFAAIARHHYRLKLQLLNYWLTLALADGHFDQSERDLLYSVAAQLGFNRTALDRMVEMVQAQSQFGAGQRSAGGAATTGAAALATAYRALGVNSSASDAELKKAYRKLVSENHPDKLIGQGMPADMVKLATERSQEIHAAYEMVTAQRKAAN